MLDPTFIRTHPELVKKNLEKRNQQEKITWVDDYLQTDKAWRELTQKAEQLRHKRNTLTLEITKLRQANKDATKTIKEAKTIPEQIKHLEEQTTELRKKSDYYLLRFPNTLANDVPIGKDANENKIVKKSGKIPKATFPLKSHTELIEALRIGDFDAGRKVAGQGFNYLSHELALLDNALQRYGVDFLLKKGFTLVSPPMMLNHETLDGVVDLSAFQEVIYKVQDEDLHLIGTAEHSLVSMLRDKTLDVKQLPMKVCAVTPCFRKEIGGHGVDMKGIFRMHQFNKVEQVVFTTPENSSKMLQTMQKITEQFFQSLKIPYRVIEICSGDLGGKFAKQYDIEAWFPRQDAYCEVTSAGNCTDYQARRLNIKYMDKGERNYVHILNNTMVATSRAMVAILENYQQKDGSVKIPSVLYKYMHGIRQITRKK